MYPKYGLFQKKLYYCITTVVCPDFFETDVIKVRSFKEASYAILISFKKCCHFQNNNNKYDNTF